MPRIACIFLLPLTLTAAACQATGSDEVGALAPAALGSSGVQLIAIGELPGTVADLSHQTGAALENGMPGNLLGGLGSGLAYAGWGRFLAVPDRGPNAQPYDSAVDDTASYINRFQ